jgi:hypothetical protein
VASTLLGARAILVQAATATRGEREARDVRGDLTREQILDMTIAIATIHGGPGHLGAILRATFDGLRLPTTATRRPTAGRSRSAGGARQRRGDELVGDPRCDVDGVGRRPPRRGTCSPEMCGSLDACASDPAISTSPGAGHDDGKRFGLPERRRPHALVAAADSLDIAVAGPSPGCAEPCGPRDQRRSSTRRPVHPAGQVEATRTVRVTTPSAT